MKALSKSYGFLTCFLFWCVQHEVRCVPLDFDLSFPPNDFNDNQSPPIDFDREYNHVTEDILSNIESHYNESEIGIHSSEDVVDLDNAFKNQTFAQNEIIKNDTKTRSYHLANDNLNQNQTTNSTNYLLHVNDTSQTKQSSVQKQGKTKDTRDYYKDGKLSKNVRLQTTDDRMETSDIDQALRRKEILAHMASTGDLRYEAKNDSDAENKEISSQYVKNGHHVTDDTAKQEKNFQDVHFARTKTIHQSNDRRTNSEKEQITKSGSKDYTREGSSGLETLQQRCLNHLRQENEYKDQDKEIRRLRNRKNRKKTFFKRIGDSGPKSTWPNWDDFPEDCKDLLQEEINIQNMPPEGKRLNVGDRDSVPETGRSFDNPINTENSTKEPSSTPPTPTTSPQDDDSQDQTTVTWIETTTTPDPSFESPPEDNENRKSLRALREKFNLIQNYISKQKDCDDNKYGFSERLKPTNQTKTKSNLTSLSRRVQTDPEIIFQDKNVTNQTIECIQGEVNCTQDYYEYYYVEENVYGDNDDSEEESTNETPILGINPRRFRGTNPKKKKTTRKEPKSNSKPIQNET